MNVIRIFAILIIAAVTSIIVKGTGGKLGYLIGISCLTLTGLWFITKTTPILQYVTALNSVSGEVVVTITKVVGIAYLSDFAASLCRDMGESGIAIGAETLGKTEILIIGFPLFKKMIEICTELIG